MGIQIIRKNELKEGPQTGGMIRRQAFVSETVWAGEVITPAGIRSGWHEHGEYDTYVYIVEGMMRLESGIGGSDIIDAEKGDFLLVQSHTVHREGNPGNEASVAIGVRIGSGPTVFNVDGPERSK